MRIVLFTAIFGDCDRLWSINPRTRDRSQFVCFTDTPKRQVGLWVGSHAGHIAAATYGLSMPPIWDIRIVEPAYGPRRTARHYKCLPHRYFPDADAWIWVDGSVRLLMPPSKAVSRWLIGDLAIFDHPERSCLYDEAASCIKLGKDTAEVLNKQVARYRSEGMPEDWGLAETGCIIRRNTPKIREFNEAWWSEIEKGSSRDQVPLPYVCWKLGLRWDVIPDHCRAATGENFAYIKHRR